MKKKLKLFFVQILRIPYRHNPVGSSTEYKRDNVPRQQGRRETLLQGLQGCRQVGSGIRKPLAEGQGWGHGVPHTVVSRVPLLRGDGPHRQVLPCARQKQCGGGEAPCFQRASEAHPGPRGVPVLQANSAKCDF